MSRVVASSSRRLLAAHNARPLTDEEEEKLYYNVTSGDAGLLKLMIEDGTNVNEKFHGSNQLDKSILHLCCEKGLYDCAKLLLEAGALPNAVDAWYQTPLMYCICTERENMTRLMVDFKCFVNARDKFGKTALHYAVFNSELGCMETLLRSKINVDAGDEAGRSPLWLAVSEDGRTTVVKRLIDAHCDVNMRDQRESRSPLQAAIVNTRQDTLAYVELLLEAGATPNVVDLVRQTPMTMLIRRGKIQGATVSRDHLRIAQLLLRAGYDVDFWMRKQYDYQYQGTALLAAVERGALDYVTMLLEAGADPDIADENSVTPLLLAAYHNHVTIAKCLIYSNCRLLTVGKVKVGGQWQELTPFKCAVIRGHLDLAELLINAGYDLNNEPYLLTEEQIPDSLLGNMEFWTWCRERARIPASLEIQTRTLIRNTLGLRLLNKVTALPVPVKFQETVILMKNLLHAGPS